MASLDDLFNNPEAANWFKQTAGDIAKKGSKLSNSQIVKSVLPYAKKMKGMANYAVTAAAPAAINNEVQLYNYIKALGDYATVAKKNQAISGKTDQQIKADFDRLYFSKHPDKTLVTKMIKNIKPTAVENALAQLKQNNNQQASKDAIQQVPPPTKQEQQAIATADALTKIPAGGQEQIPNPNANRTIPNVGNGGVTPIATPNGTAVGQPAVNGQATGGASNLNLNDILSLMQSVQSQKNEANADYIKLLQDITNKQEDNSKRAFYRDLGLAGLAGLSKNQSYANIIGRHNPEQEALNKLALQQQLSQAKQAQVFDPTGIIGAAPMMQKIGLPVQAALADKNTMTMYGQVYPAMLNDLTRRKEIEETQRYHDIQSQNQQNELGEKIREFNNPHYNNLASEAQMLSSFFANAPYIPAIREMMNDPNFLRYAVSKMGYNPTSIPTQPTVPTSAKHPTQFTTR